MSAPVWSLDQGCSVRCKGILLRPPTSNILPMKGQLAEYTDHFTEDTPVVRLVRITDVKELPGARAVDGEDRRFLLTFVHCGELNP